MTEKAYDPDHTPNSLAGEVDQELQPVTDPPLAPERVGELFTDKDTGEPRYVAANDDGTPVALHINEEDTP